MNEYTAIGLMSGSSLDGLDIACCNFSKEGGNWNYRILATDVIPYSAGWIDELKQLPAAGSKIFWEKHVALGHYFGERVNSFIANHKLQGKVDLIASHGHTVFHFPDKGFTTQIGDGAAIAAKINIPVVCDFRSADIANGGQGTPIVPIGDLLLFREHRLCLNIGGIANISCKLPAAGRPIVAFDVCAANQVLNALASLRGKEYDEAGALAARGSLNPELLRKLNELEYCELPYPKSLDNSYSRDAIAPVINAFKISVEDKLRTYVEHIAQQIANHIELIAWEEKISFNTEGKILATGGGAFNKFLMERLRSISGLQVDVPGDELVKFKEAVVIAFMGVLRMRNEVNVLKSVTGAAKDTIGGAVYAG